MEIETGGPAFPLPLGTANMSEPGESGGMTLRDYFAAKEMQSLIECAWERNGDTNYICDNDGRVSLHLRAYEHADAMLVQRSRE